MNFAPLTVGDITIPIPLVLAPMSGVTDISFRRLIRELNPGTIGLSVTEFISVEALTRNNLRSLEMMRAAAGECPFSVQIFGHDLQRMEEAARIVEASGADIVDINSGCPVPKVVRRGGGCELMRQPNHLAKLLETVRRAVKIPLTLKIRAGWDSTSVNALEIARIAEDVGVQMLAVHGRTRAEGYRGLADWDLIGQVARSVKIPVVGSGDVVDLDTAKERFASGVKGLMIGRGVLENPWIFTEIVSGFLTSGASQSGGWVAPPAAATVDVLERYIALLLEVLPERAAIGRMKQLASQLTRRVRGSQGVRRKLCTSKSIGEFRDVLSGWRDEISVGNLDVESVNSTNGEVTLL